MLTIAGLIAHLRCAPPEALVVDKDGQPLAAADLLLREGYVYGHQVYELGGEVDPRSFFHPGFPHMQPCVFFDPHALARRPTPLWWLAGRRRCGGSTAGARAGSCWAAAALPGARQ